jgi:hypothetical protein
MPRRLGLVLHVLGTAGGSAWIATHVDLGQAIATFAYGASRISLEQMTIGRPLGERLPIAGGHGHGGEFIENAGPTSIFGHKQP